MNIKLVLSAMTVIVLSGCNATTTPENYALRQQLYKGSPALKQDFVKSCAKRIQKANSTPQKAAYLAKLTNSSVQAAPRVGCQRVADGLVSGRLRYEDYRMDVEQKRMTPNMARILQGK